MKTNRNALPKVKPSSGVVVLLRNLDVSNAAMTGEASVTMLLRSEREVIFKDTPVVTKESMPHAPKAMPYCMAKALSCLNLLADWFIIELPDLLYVCLKRRFW